MKCHAAKTFLSRINDREEPIAPISSPDLDYLSTNGYVLRSSKTDYDKGVEDVAKLSQMIAQLDTERKEAEQASAALQQDERKEHSFLFLFEGQQEKAQFRERIQNEMAVASKEESEATAMEASVNQLIQEKSMVDRMVAYDGEYLSLTGLGTLVLNDLNIRSYRVADQEFPDFLSEIKTTYAELRHIADKATSYIVWLRPRIPGIEASDESEKVDGRLAAEVSSVVWSIAIGLAKLQGEGNQIAERFIQALAALRDLDSSIPNKLMAAEIMTAVSSQDVQSLQSVLRGLDHQLRNEGVPKEKSAGVAAIIVAGRRWDGTYPVGRFAPFRQLTPSFEAASILAVMNVPSDELSSKFKGFRELFTSWGFMTSEDTEIASAFLAIGELVPEEIQTKLRYVIEQLKNYLQYPLVAAAILASIPVFESHEVLDLMEKAVTLLSGYTSGLDRSHLVALAVRMIHGVRNELVKKIDPTATVTETPVQFRYGSHPGFFGWYYPVIVAH